MDGRTTAPRAVNQAGIDLVKRFEGLRLEAYLCPADVPTIGWGHTRGVRLGDRIDEAEAERFLVEDLAEAGAAVERLVQVPLNDNEFAALASWAFNLGAGNLSRSTALHRLNAGEEREAVANALTSWNKGRVGGKLKVLGGLVDRRAAEAALFLTPPVSA